MNTLTQVKILFSKRNLYFIASFLILVSATIALLFLLKGQTASNLQAKLLYESNKELSLILTTKERLLADKKEQSIKIPSADEVIDPEENISEITRYLDDVFTKFPGEIINTNLSFSTLREAEGLAYTEASLSITSSKENFFNFLNFIENTGFVADGQSRLMEIRSININLSSREAEDTLSYRVVMRIYSRSQKKEEPVTTDENNNPFENIF